MRIFIYGTPKAMNDNRVVIWEEGRIKADKFIMFLLKEENEKAQGEILGHPVGECPGTHNHLELLECFSDIVNRIFEPGFEVTTTDGGKTFDGYPEPDYSEIPEGAVL